MKPNPTAKAGPHCRFEHARTDNRRAINLLAPFTPTAKGYNIWYKGKTRLAAPASTPHDRVPDEWSRRKAVIDAEGTERLRDIVARMTGAAGGGNGRGAGMTVVKLASAFFEHLDHRVATGKPKRMQPTTAWDYKRTINEFGAAAGPNTALEDLAPEHFTAFAHSIAQDSPIRFGVKVAYVEYFMRWAMNSGYLARNRVLASLTPGVDPFRALVGPDLVKPHEQDVRDDRLGKSLAWTPAEIRKLWKVADLEEQCFIGCGINFAFDNADLAHVTDSVMDTDGATVDFRRRKRGKIKRVAPIHPELRKLLKRYRADRPALAPVAAAGDEPGGGGEGGEVELAAAPVAQAGAAAADERFFRTPTGLPLQRIVRSKKGRENTIDYVNMVFARLAIRAGLRAPFPKRRKTGRASLPDEPLRPRRHRARGSVGRGFRSLRTAFTNLAPPGYREEIEIVTGHAQGTVLLDRYLEVHGTARLEELINHVWHRALTCPSPLGEDCRCPGFGGGSPGGGRGRGGGKRKKR
jgi:integrase